MFVAPKELLIVEYQTDVLMSLEERSRTEVNFYII